MARSFRVKRSSLAALLAVASVGHAALLLPVLGVFMPGGPVNVDPMLYSGFQSAHFACHRAVGWRLRLLHFRGR